MRSAIVTALACAALALSACEGEDGVPTPAPDARAEVTAAAALPLPRTEVAGAALGDDIVVAGGLLLDGTPSARVDVYDRAADSWREGPPLPTALHHVGMTAARGRVWVVGGYTTGPDGAWKESAAVWSLGPDDEAWRAEPALGSARGALAVAAIDGTIVAFGGVVNGSPTNTSEQLRDGASAWTRAPDMTEAREHLAATTIDGLVLAIAGRTGGMETNQRSVESWDGRDASWTKGPDLNGSRGGTAASGRCVAGGEEPGGTIATVECLDGGRWEVVAELRRPRHGLAVVAAGSNLHVIGGGEKPGLFVSGAHEVVRLAR